MVLFFLHVIQYFVALFGFFFNHHVQLLYIFSLHTFLQLISSLLDLETSVDSRCTTDSADSAFFGRRY